MVATISESAGREALPILALVPFPCLGKGSISDRARMGKWSNLTMAIHGHNGEYDEGVCFV